MRSHSSLWLALVLLCVPLNGLGQETPPQGFSEVIEVRVVEVDVVVTDRQGNPLTNLKREDFELFVDRKPVEISHFARIVDGLLQLQPIAGEPGTTPTAEEIQATRSPVTWVIFIDQTNLHPSRRNEALRQLLNFMQTGMEAGDRAVVASNDGVAFRVRQGLTDDWKLLLETVDRMRKQRVNPAPGFTEKNRLLKLINNEDRSDREFRYIGNSIAIEIQRVIEEEVQRTRNAIRSMGALLGGLKDVEGRVAILYVGTGFNTIPALDLYEAWQQRFSGGADPIQLDWPGGVKPEDYQPRLEAELTRLLGTISATRVTIYTIHGGDGGMISAEGPTHLVTNDGGNPGDRSQMTETSLARTMAEQTGGRFFKVNPQLARQMETVRRDLSNYYSLGYIPEGAPGISRSVRVKVKVDGARVLHRDAVRERTPEEAAGDDLVATLVKGPRIPSAAGDSVVPAAAVSQANPLGVSVEADRPRRTVTGDYALPFRLDLRLENLTFWSTGRAHRAALTFHFALVGPDGTTWHLESREQTLEIPDAQYASDDGQSLVTHAWHLNLGPLRVPAKVPVQTAGMRLMVTVEDRASQTRSVIPVSLPDPKRP